MRLNRYQAQMPFDCFLRTASRLAIMADGTSGSNGHPVLGVPILGRPSSCQGPVGIKPTAKKNSRPPGGRAYSERLPPGGRRPFPAGCFIHPESRRSSRYGLGTPPVLPYRSLFVTCSRCGLPLPNLWATSSKVTLYLPGGRSPSLLKVGKKATLKQTLRLCGAVCRRHSRGRWGGLFRGCTGPSG